MSAMVNAMRVLTDTANCGTAVISAAGRSG